MMMSKEIIGIYDSLDDAIQQIENLGTKGYRQDKVAVITNNRKRDELDEELNVKVSSGIPEKNADSLKEKIVDFFTDDTIDPYIHLVEFGIPEEIGRASCRERV